MLIVICVEKLYQYLKHFVQKIVKINIKIWLKEEKYYNVVKDAFTSKEAKQYFNTGNLVKLLNQHYEGKKDNSRKIWTLYMFIVWYRQYFV